MAARAEEVDVLVVGGGPAGLAAAAAAAVEGASVLLVERRSSIGHPVHTSGATSFETMSRWRIPRRLWHPVSRARFVSSREEADFEFSSPPLCVIDVRGTYRWLADRAAESGARVETGVRFVAPIVEGRRTCGAELTGRGAARRVRAGVVIDASGYRAAVSKLVGLHPGFSRFGVGYEYELHAPRCRQDEVVVVVGERHAPTGYGWVFPWGDGRVRVGVGLHHSDTRQDPKQHLDALVDDSAAIGVDLSGAEIVEHHVGLVPAERLPDRLVGDGVLAVGDAACQATLVAGEGIRLSLAAGDLAGHVAARAVAAVMRAPPRSCPMRAAFAPSSGVACVSATRSTAGSHASMTPVGTRISAGCAASHRLRSRSCSSRSSRSLSLGRSRAHRGRGCRSRTPSAQRRSAGSPDGVRALEVR